jgi:hypothetical protein
MSKIETMTISINDVTPHPRNFRQGDIGAICESLKAHGQYRPITYQKSTGRILAGNHTWKAAKALGWKEITASAIECDDEQALRILLIDNRTSDLADYDTAELAEILQELEATSGKLDGTGYDGDALDEIMKDVASQKEMEDQLNAYTQIIRVPQYEIVGEQPPIHELFDTSKYLDLVQEINKSKIPDDIKEFLRLAATRHIVFTYSKIAEFYPHQNNKVQELMERSVLVIIDSDDAIANGYATFAKTMTDLLRQDDES